MKHAYLKLQTLGPFSAALDNQPIHNFKTNKVQGLLIYLAVERDRTHHRESLMELFWPGMPIRIRPGQLGADPLQAEEIFTW